MLTVHKTIKKPHPNLTERHRAAARRSMLRYAEAAMDGGAGDRSDLLKAVNHGARAVGNMERASRKTDDPEDLFEFCDMVKDFISMLTPRELMQVFPIRKEYDGEKWQTKDYYSSIKAVQAHGLDKTIGEDIDSFLWDYMNLDLMYFEVTHMGAVSELHRRQTGEGIMEQWAREQGIPTYTMCKDPDTGKEFLFDRDNGRSIGVSRPLPRHLKLA